MRRVMEALRPLAVLFLLTACSGSEKQDVLGSATATGSNAGGDGGTTSSGGTDPISTADCTPEEEKNDGREAANTIDSSRCGELTERDQIDFLTFKLKPATKEMTLNFKGSVKLKIEIEGKETIELTPTSNVSVPFVMGKSYFVEIRALERQASTPWRVDVVQK